ncbi:hypothetical protein P8C59_008685 [Phyllachora maydis]|uniref:Uncharacterized protein n=1 Tax=Phyllachora maydis TaxID=1825666 RepID=A0AAD9ICA4_9PEZI|nr:hypothetical protein P8C59_008685 [Phyllachora maydis]
MHWNGRILLLKLADTGLQHLQLLAYWGVKCGHRRFPPNLRQNASITGLHFAQARRLKPLDNRHFACRVTEFQSASAKMQAVPSLVGTGTVIAAAAAGLRYKRTLITLRLQLRNLLFQFFQLLGFTFPGFASSQRVARPLHRNRVGRVLDNDGRKRLVTPARADTRDR